LFKQYYSDHFPVVFKIIVPHQDDDGVWRKLSLIRSSQKDRISGS
jgi:hypothetical protein